MRNDTSLKEMVEKNPSRESLLKITAALIDNLQKRVNVKRFKAQSGDSVRLGYVRTLLTALTVMNSLLRDSELEVVKKELEEVRELVKNQACQQVRQ